MTAPDPSTSQVAAPSRGAPVVFDAAVKPTFKLLSILIPVYNEERYLAAVVKRVVDQPLPGGLVREIIMVNDASKDRTWEIMQKLPEIFPGINFTLVNLVSTFVGMHNYSGM